MGSKSMDRRVLIAFTLTILFGGSNAIAVRYSNAELPPFFGAAIRFGAAALILFVTVLILRLSLPRGRSLLGAVIYGLLGTGLNYALIYWALQYIPASLSMVILALTPLLTFLFAWAHGQERFRWKAVFGALLAVAGISIIAWNRLNASAPILPILAMVGAAACFAESTVVVKSFPQSNPITTNAIALSSGAILLFVISAIFRETPTLPTLPATWEALAYLILLGSVVTFVLMVYVLKRWTASANSYLFVLMPIVTITLGALIAKETISSAFIYGCLFVLSGAYIGGIARPEQFSKILAMLPARRQVPTPDCVVPDC